MKQTSVILFSVSKKKEAHLPPDFVRYCHAAQLNEDTY